MSAFEDWILYQDEDMVVVNKPAGVATLHELATGPHSILEAARHWDDKLQVVHRLDKYTTGCLALARHPEAYRTLAMQFETREVEKRYEALVHGHLPLESLQIDAPLERSGSGKTRVAARGKEALTLAKVLIAYRHHSLVACKPITGRTHQLRVHLAYVGCPIVGDDAYGGGPLLLSHIKRGYRPKKEQEERPLSRHYVLHAAELKLKQPRTGEAMHFTAPRDAHFETLLKQLGKHSAVHTSGT